MPHLRDVARLHQTDAQHHHHEGWIPGTRPDAGGTEPNMANIVHHKDRLIHPYTVWHHGEVVKFCATLQEARDVARVTAWRK